jgi:hypothetical protein
MSDLTQLSDDDLVKMFTQMSQEALGPSSAAPMSSAPIRTDMTQATSKGSSEKFIDPAGTKAAGEIQNEIDLDLEAKKSEINNLYKARADLDTYTSDAMKALVGIDKLSIHAEDLGDFDRGFLPQTYSRLKMGVDTYAKEKNVTRYLGVLAQELIPFARNLMEEKGPITESDVDRIGKGLGDLTTPLEDKKYLLNELRKKVGLALKNKAQVAGIPEDSFKKKYSTLSRMAFDQEKDPSEMTPEEIQAELNSLKGGTQNG